MLLTGGIFTLWWGGLGRDKRNAVLKNPPGETPASLGPALVSSAGDFSGGRRLFNLLQESTLSPVQAQAISQSLAKILPPGQLRSEDRYEIVTTTSGQFQRLTVSRGFDQAVVLSTGGVLVARWEVVPTTTTIRRAQGVVTESLWLAAVQQGLSPNVIDGLANQIFPWAIDFNVEVRPGDRFALIYKEEHGPDPTVKRDTILAAIYEGKVTGRQVALRFMDDYFDEKGDSLRRTFLHAPLAFQRISSGFNRLRFHPILRIYRAHHGTDYAAPRGTPVRAVGDGVVSFRGWEGGYGRMVRLHHNATYTSVYGHLSRWGPQKLGQRVKQGEVIGYVGSTGLATGPHLHFEMRVQGRSINFLTLKPPAAGNIPESRRKAFEGKRDEWLKALNSW